MSNFIVLDDFCLEPDKLVQSAKESGFGTWVPNKGETGASRYQGMNFWGAHALVLPNIMAAMGKVIVPNSMFFRVTNEDTDPAYIHSDREQGNYTCVLYLSEHSSEYGTGFYKHLPTGLDMMPSNAEMKSLGIFDSLTADMVNRTPAAWQMTDYVQAKYNRAVIFKAPMFHSRLPVTGIGSSEEDGRLVWVSHFYTLEDLGE